MAQHYVSVRHKGAVLCLAAVASTAAPLPPAEVRLRTAYGVTISNTP